MIEKWLEVIHYFSPGWGEHFSQNTVLMEELASHGYIVFSIAHHYEAKFSFYPDGHFITIDDSSERFLEIMDEQRNPEAFAVFEKMRKAKNYEEQEGVFKQSNELMPKLLNDYTLAFFNKHLKGTDSGLLNGPSSEYPEVEIKVKYD